MLAKKTLELNPHHPVIKSLLNKVKEAGDGELDPDTIEYADLLYNMAMLNSGFLIENPTDFTQPMQKLIKLGFGLDRHATVEEIEVDISGLDEEGSVKEEPDVAGDIEVEDTASHTETHFQEVPKDDL